MPEYESINGQEYIVIDDSNYQQYLNEAAADGRVAGIIPRKSAIGELELQPGMYAAVLAEKFPLIPESQWKDRIAAMQGRFARQRNEAAGVKDCSQGSFGYCWAFSLAQCIQSAHVAAGRPHIELGAESLGGAVNWRNQGYYLDGAIAYAVKHGIASRAFIPNLNINPKSFKSRWEVDAMLHRPIATEIFDGGAKAIWAETVTTILSGYSVYMAYNWASHALQIDELVIDSKGEICPSLTNSWGPGQRWVIKGSKKIPSELYVLRVATHY